MSANPTDHLLLCTATTPPPSAVTAQPDATLQRRVAAGAACAGSGDDSVWFPETMLGQRAQAKYSEHARAACLGCPVAGECLELALRAEDTHGGGSYGVRGAAAPWERQAMIRSRRLARTAVAS